MNESEKSVFIAHLSYFIIFWVHRFPFDAERQPSGGEPMDAMPGFRNGCAGQGIEFGCGEPAPDGDETVVAGEAVAVEKGEGRKPEIGFEVAFKVAKDETPANVRLPETKQADDVVVAEMVEKMVGKDKVDRFVRPAFQ